MKRVVTVILTENLTSGNRTKVFPDQTVEIMTEEMAIAHREDGRITTARHPSEVTWLGGTVAATTNITDVQLVADNGAVLIDGELNTSSGEPCEVDNGVRFFVL
jgi:hypothetical protein